MARPSQKDETRTVLTKVGHEMLVQTGLTIGLDAISLERAHVLAGVPRSTAYNAWADQHGDATPQEAFRRAVLTSVVRNPIDQTELDDTIDAISDVDLSGLTEGIERRAAVEKEIFRRGAKANAAAIASSQPWRIATAVYGVIASTPEGDRDPELLEALRSSELTWRATVVDQIYRPFADLLGLRPRGDMDPEVVWESFTVAAAALAEGLAPRYLLNPEVVDNIVVKSPDGDSEWTLFALGFEALVRHFFVHDDD